MKVVKRNRRNGIIELWRFIASISIAAYHFEWIYNGEPIWCTHFYIFVEFFFVLSGFFLVINIQKYSNNLSSWEYVLNQAKKLYPIYVGGFVVSFITVCIVEEILILEWGHNLWKAKWEILLLSMAGFNNTEKVYNLGGAPQYISSLMLGTLILHFLIKNYKEVFKNLIGPMIIVAGFARIINNYGNLSQWMAFDGIFNIGVIRGITDMSVGAMSALLLVPQLEKCKESSKVKIFWGGVVLSLGQLLILSFFDEFISYNDLILWVFIYAIMIVIFYVTYIRLSEEVNTFFVNLGKVSYPVFVFHYAVILVFSMLEIDCNYYVVLLLYLINVICVAIVGLLCEKIFRKRYCIRRRRGNGFI